jgi:hypothetical protein
MARLLVGLFLVHSTLVLGLMVHHARAQERIELTLERQEAAAVQRAVIQERLDEFNEHLACDSEALNAAVLVILDEVILARPRDPVSEARLRQVRDRLAGQPENGCKEE